MRLEERLAELADAAIPLFLLPKASASPSPYRIIHVFDDGWVETISCYKLMNEEGDGNFNPLLDVTLRAFQPSGKLDRTRVDGSRSDLYHVWANAAGLAPIQDGCFRPYEDVSAHYLFPLVGRRSHIIAFLLPDIVEWRGSEKEPGLGPYR